MDDWTQEKFEEMRRDWKDRNLVGWKLYYTKRHRLVLPASSLIVPNGADIAAITSAQIQFDDAPQRGVQVLKKFYRREKGQGISPEVQNGLDMYILYSINALNIGLPPQVKLGENLDHREFRTILDAARADREIVAEMV